MAIGRKRVPVVEITNVFKRFPSGTLALDGVSLSVDAERVLVLLGTSGSGKTTALKLVNRLIEPDSGEVSVFGSAARLQDAVGLRRRIGYVIQEVGLLPHLSVAENVALVPALLGWDAARRQARVHELLELVGLAPERFARLSPRELSGGQKQRVGIARALGADPPLLLMDEPFGSLDPLTRRRLQDEFKDLQRRLGRAVILVTHDLPEAVRLGDEIALMHEGRVLQRGTPHELLDAPQPGFARDFVRATLP